MDLDTVILSGVSQTEEYRCHMILLKCGIFKNGTNELIYRIKLLSQMYGKNLWLPRGEWVGWDKLGNWDRHIHTTTCK